jgi:hypothetical protein
MDSNSEDDGGKDSKIGKNLEICELEKRDFEDEEGGRTRNRIS